MNDDIVLDLDYVDMCSKAKIFQDRWMMSVGDYYYQCGRLGIISGETKISEVRNSIWFPRQDQYQLHIMMKDDLKIMSVMSMFDKFLYRVDPEKGYPWTDMHSIEAAWLVLAMRREGYKWTGSDWEEI